MLLIKDKYGIFVVNKQRYEFQKSNHPSKI